MNPTLNILGISGSLRAQSRNTGLLRFAKQCLPPTVNFQIADLADVPFYNADRCDSKPEPVQTLIRQVTEADALVLACPEYNYSIAPALMPAAKERDEPRSLADIRSGGVAPVRKTRRTS